jgi:uncharacterized RDD family membrane protein YckC
MSANPPGDSAYQCDTDSLSEIIRIETPENVAFSYEIAGIGSRFLAAAIDRLIILVLQGAILVGAFLLIQNSNTDLDTLETRLLVWLIGFVVLIEFLVYWGFYIFFEMLWNGQSPGKRWTGLRVIHNNGDPINLPESVIRNLVRMIDMLPSFYGLGLVIMFIDSRSRRLGDLAAGTLVVYDKDFITLESLKSAPLMQAARPILSPLPDLPIQLLKSSDLYLAEEFIRRRDGLAGRKELAIRIARALFERMGMPDHAIQPIDAEPFIEQVVMACRSMDPE